MQVVIGRQNGIFGHIWQHHLQICIALYWLAVFFVHLAVVALHGIFCPNCCSGPARRFCVSWNYHNNSWNYHNKKQKQGVQLIQLNRQKNAEPTHINMKMAKVSSSLFRFTTQHALAKLPKMGRLDCAWWVANCKPRMVGFTTSWIHVPQ